MEAAPPHPPSVPRGVDAPLQTFGEELRALVHLAWPIAAAQLGLITMGLVDTAVLGRVSTTELAGAAIGRSVAFGCMTLAMGVATGLEPIAAQAIGAGDPVRAWQGLKTTVATVLSMWAPLMAVAFAVSFTLEPIGVAPAIASRVRLFLLGQAPGLACSMLFLSGKTFLQAHGKTRPALVASIVANLVNLVVCNLLVRGDDTLIAMHLRPRGLPRLGALGAGLAFSVSSVILASIVLSAAWTYRPRVASVRLPYSLVIRLGLPVGLQMLAEIGVFTVATLIVGRFGPEAVSAHQIALSLASFMYMGAVGISGATAVRVGHAVGAGRSPRRVGWMGIGVGAAFMAVGALAFAIAPGGLMRIFTSDPEVVALGTKLLFIAAIFQLFDGVQTVAGGALRGAGDVRFTFVANVAAHWAIGFPLACVLGLALGLGVTGIWWGLTAGIVVIAFLLGDRFARVSKRKIARI